jgi:hypothetical protein
VELRENQNVDVGKIVAKVRYGRVELSILDAENKPFYKTGDGWSELVLIQRDETGKAVGSESLSINDIAKSVRMDRGSMSLVLPEGKWSLELLDGWDDFDSNGRTHRFLAKTTVSVVDGDTNPPAQLIVKQSKGH